MFKLTGSIKMINATIQVSDRFSKREFVVSDTSSQYPQDILFQSTQDKCSLLDQFQVSDQIEVSFNLRGREWTSPQGEIKYFNTLEAWRIEKVGMPTGGPSPISLDPNDFPSEKSPAAGTKEDDDDLPF